MKLSVSMNFTIRYKVDILDFIRYEFEFNLVPMIFNVAYAYSSSSLFGDNCIEAYYNYHTLMFDTRMTKNIKKCDWNIKDAVIRSSSFDHLLETIFNTPAAAADMFKCEFDEIDGPNT